MPKGVVERHAPDARDAEPRPAEIQPILAASHRGPGEDDDVEDLREDQRGDGEVDVAQPG
jgi:hypothetical protein